MLFLSTTQPVRKLMSRRRRDSRSEQGLWQKQKRREEPEEMKRRGQKAKQSCLFRRLNPAGASLGAGQLPLPGAKAKLLQGGPGTRTSSRASARSRHVEHQGSGREEEEPERMPRCREWTEKGPIPRGHGLPALRSSQHRGPRKAL